MNNKEEIWSMIQENWRLMEDEKISDLTFVRLSEKNMELLKLHRQLKKEQEENN